MAIDTNISISFDLAEFTRAFGELDKSAQHLVFGMAVLVFILVIAITIAFCFYVKLKYNHKNKQIALSILKLIKANNKKKNRF